MDQVVDDNKLWLERLRRDGKEALAAAMEHFRPRLMRMVEVRMDPRLAGRADASDVLQETYLDAARQIESYLAEPRLPVFVWLRYLTWERLMNFYRHNLGALKRAVRREVNLPDESSIALGNLLLAPGPSPSREARRTELKERIEKALAALPERDQEVILLRHFEELSNKETAAVLGLNESTATMRYGRALVRLKDALAEDSSAAGASGDTRS
ncbi:MAG TPA: RNA polymerase subunit sigma-24 [Planctomycetes bacterium]|nr:RNA polymerase subunit sigma-24 [Planctomycetota bacterium]